MTHALENKMDKEKQRLFMLKAIRYAGSQTKLAEKIGVRQQHVWSWLNGCRTLSLARALDIQNVTKFEVLAREIYPQYTDML
jgi:DNA-binding transcriptional regulator YdaS (Cro superfamily)